MTLKHWARKRLWKLGYDVVEYRQDLHAHARRRRLLERAGIDAVLDVGANTGQFAAELRADFGWCGRIVSFEPLAAAYATLAARAAADGQWDARPYALGDSDGSARIGVAGNSWSSSLLEMLPAHLDAAPESAFTGYETVQTRRLDSVIDALCPAPAGLYLKLDVQGFERQVLAGAQATLARVRVLQLEMSLTPLYAGAASFGELHALLESRGLVLFGLEPGFARRDSGQLLQLDGLYCPREVADAVRR
ncbi:MAG: FkbM family methyltransferase [Gammaproteobacteria bacterium]